MKSKHRMIDWEKTLLLLLLLMHFGLRAQELEQQFPKSFAVEVSNPLNQLREEVLVLVPESRIKKNHPAFNANAFIVMDGQKEVPSQYQHSGNDAGIVLVLDALQAKATKKLQVRYNQQGKQERNYPKRTQAELSHKVGGHFENRKYIGGKFRNVESLRVPAEHTDHSYFIRYEGPGWESDKVGYRYYLDWRNAIDVFGKKTGEMVLQQVGQDGFDSYHHMQDWGMDVLKVGKSLGVGSLGIFHEGKAIRVDKTDSVFASVQQNGPVQSAIHTNYWGWQVAGQKLDIASLLSIHAGSRLTHHQLTVSGGAPQNLCTGINKDAKAKLHISKGSNNSWAYLATWGAQSLNNDQLGLAILFRPQDLQKITADEFSHVVSLKPAGGKLEYYFLAAWELEQEGIKNEEQFLAYLNKTAKELAQPVSVKVSK